MSEDNIHETAPESLDPEAADFLAKIGPEKRWKVYEMCQKMQPIVGENQVKGAVHDPLVKIIQRFDSGSALPAVVFR